MSRALGLFLLLLQSASGYEYPLKPVQVSSQVHCFFGATEIMDTTNNGNISNSCYVDAGDRYIVIDTGSSYAYAKSAFNAMQHIKKQPVELAVNTHVHDDHWLGNNFFTDQGIRVLGSDDFSKSVNLAEANRMQNRISKEAYEGTVPTLPTVQISKNTDLKIGTLDVQFRLIPSRAHTAKDLYVYIPQLETLFAGDLVFNERVPSLIGGDINGWIKALETLDSLHAKHVIGGHGQRTDDKAHLPTTVYMNQIHSKVKNAIDSGKGIDETMNSVQLDEYKNYALYETMQRLNVESAYRVIEWE